MTEYLRKKGTNEVFVWTPMIAKRKDMEPYTFPSETPKEEPVEPQDTAPTTVIDPPVSVGKGPDAPEAPPAKEPPVIPSSLDPNKIVLIKEAIKTLSTDGFTKSGLPHVRALANALDMEVTTEERDYAMLELNHEANGGAEG